MNRKRVLVVEDEQIIALDLEQCLQTIGFDVSFETTGAGAVKAAAQLKPDLVLMDIRLDGCLDGIQAAIQIREQSPIPLIFVTAFAESSTVQRVAQAGPSGFIVKPFNEKQLAANIYLALNSTPSHARIPDYDRPAAVQLSESHPPPPELKAGVDPVLRIGDLEIDRAQRHVWLQGRNIKLTLTEFEILAYLAERPGISVSRDALLSGVWGAQFVHYIQTLRVHIGNLRQKIRSDSPNSVRIEVVRGIGYRLVESGSHRPYSTRGAQESSSAPALDMTATQADSRSSLPGTA